MAIGPPKPPPDDEAVLVSICIPSLKDIAPSRNPVRQITWAQPA
jgi:hypothetical protein